jgi:hypothetical protein
MQSVRRPGAGPSGGSGERLITAGAYVVLLALGALEGLVGSFQYSRALGSVPVAAVAFALLIGVTCVLGAWGMHGPLGGLLPAVGWLVATFVLAMGTAGGSVVITNGGAGQWFLYGGSVCAIVGVFTGFVRWSSPRRRIGQRGDQVWPREIAPAGQRGSGAYASAGQAPGRQAQVNDAPRADGEAPGAGTPDAGAAGTAELEAGNADARKPDA